MLEEDGKDGTVAGGCGCCCCGCGVGRYCFDVSDILAVFAKDRCEDAEEEKLLSSESEPGRRSRVPWELFRSSKARLVLSS